MNLVDGVKKIALPNVGGPYPICEGLIGGKRLSKENLPSLPDCLQAGGEVSRFLIWSPTGTCIIDF